MVDESDRKLFVARQENVIISLWEERKTAAKSGALPFWSLRESEDVLSPESPVTWARTQGEFFLGKTVCGWAKIPARALRILFQEKLLAESHYDRSKTNAITDPRPRCRKQKSAILGLKLPRSRRGMGGGNWSTPFAS
jgi:hypothetical protein